MLCLFASGAQRNERKETKFSISRSHLGFRPNHLVPENMFLASCTVLFYCNVQPARLYAGGTRLIFFRMHLVFFHQLFYNPVYELPALVTTVHSGKPHYHTNIIQCRSYRFSQFISNSYGVWSFFKIVHTGQNVFIPGLRDRHFNQVHTNMVPRGYYRDRMKFCVVFFHSIQSLTFVA